MMRCSAALAGGPPSLSKHTDIFDAQVCWHTVMIGEGSSRGTMQCLAFLE